MGAGHLGVPCSMSPGSPRWASVTCPDSGTVPVTWARGQGDPAEGGVAHPCVLSLLGSRQISWKNRPPIQSTEVLLAGSLNGEGKTVSSPRTQMEPRHQEAHLHLQERLGLSAPLMPASLESWRSYQITLPLTLPPLCSMSEGNEPELGLSSSS